MKTYTIFQNGSKIKDEVTASDLFQFIPAGSVLTSGNRTKRMMNSNGTSYDEITEVKATYKLLRGGSITIVENPKPTTPDDRQKDNNQQA